MKRENGFELIVESDNGVVNLDHKEFLNSNEVDGIIKIQDKEYSCINSQNGFITHFNLEKGNHKVGSKYILMKVVKPGYYISDEDFENPVLDFKNCFVCECVDVHDNISYSELTKSEFENSFTNIQNVAELQKAILFRYNQSMPKLSDDELLELGVGLTKLKILRQI